MKILLILVGILVKKYMQKLSLDDSVEAVEDSGHPRPGSKGVKMKKRRPDNQCRNTARKCKCQCPVASWREYSYQQFILYCMSN